MATRIFLRVANSHESQNIVGASYSVDTGTRRSGMRRHTQDEEIVVSRATKLPQGRKRPLDSASLIQDGRSGDRKSKSSRRKSGSKKQHRRHQNPNGPAPYTDPDYPRISEDEEYAHIVRIGYQVVELHCVFCKGSHYYKSKPWALSGVAGVYMHIQQSHRDADPLEHYKRDKAWVAKNCVRKVLTSAEWGAVIAGTYEPQQTMCRGFAVENGQRSEEAEEES